MPRTGVITEKIKAFRAGEMRFPELVDFLIDFPYKAPSHYEALEKAKDIWEANDISDAADRNELDTWSEVRLAVSRKLLSFDELQAVEFEQMRRLGVDPMDDPSLKDRLAWLKEQGIDPKDDPFTSEYLAELEAAGFDTKLSGLGRRN